MDRSNICANAQPESTLLGTRRLPRCRATGRYQPHHRTRFVAPPRWVQGVQGWGEGPQGRQGAESGAALLQEARRPKKDSHRLDRDHDGKAGESLP